MVSMNTNICFWQCNWIVHVLFVCDHQWRQQTSTVSCRALLLTLECVRKPVWPDFSLRHVGWTVQRAEWVWIILHPVRALRPETEASSVWKVSKEKGETLVCPVWYKTVQPVEWKSCGIRSPSLFGLFSNSHLTWPNCLRRPGGQVATWTNLSNYSFSYDLLI